MGRFAGDNAPTRKTYLIGDLEWDAAELELVKSVHVQAEFDHDDDAVKKTVWLQGVADDPASKGMPNAIVGFADLSMPDVEEVLSRHAENPNVRGIRHMLNYGDDPVLRSADRDGLMSDDGWRRGCRLMDKCGTSLTCRSGLGRQMRPPGWAWRSLKFRSSSTTPECRKTLTPRSRRSGEPL